MKFNITYSYDTDTMQYIAEIPEFNLADYGDTLDEADKNLKKALELYFRELATDKNPNSKDLEYA